MEFSLRSPYPAPRATRSSFFMGVFMGVFVGMFLLYFRPFGLAGGVYTDAPEKVAFFGVISCLSYLLLEWLLPLVFPEWFEERSWKVWHTIVYYLVLLWLIASLNGLAINYYQELSFNWSNYGEIIVQTLTLGVLPITMLVLYRYNRMLRQHLQEASSLGQHGQLATPAQTSEPSVGALLAAEAFGNYVKVYRLGPEGAEQAVQRITLSGLVTQVASGALVRCHRSFAVNPALVTSVSGNAQGLRLTLRDGELEIPVSRSFIPAIRAALM